MTGPEPIRVRKPPPRVGAVGRELRELVEQRVRAALRERGWRTTGSEDRWGGGVELEPPLRAQLLVEIDTTRYREVRIAASVQVLADDVAALLAHAPDEVVTESRRIHRAGLEDTVARAGFGGVDGVRRREPLEWQARDQTGLDAAVEGFLAHLDGPVHDWLAQRSTVDGVREAAGELVHPGRGSDVRAVAALEALLGDLPAARARLVRYREDPGAGDSAGQVDAFLTWMEEAVAAHGGPP